MTVAEHLSALREAVEVSSPEAATALRAELARLDALCVLRLATPITDGLLTAEQAGKRLSRSPATMRRMAASGEIAHVRGGASILFRPEHLEEWTRRNERPAHDPLQGYGPRRRVV